MIRVGIYGATGYTGYELVKILLRHPEVKIQFATSRSYAGQKLSNLYPCPYEIELMAGEEAPLEGVDVAFLCLPHGASMGWVKRVRDAGVRVIDLSADFRLDEVEEYKRWYQSHIAPELLEEAVYGLTELYRDKVKEADLVANPGCYPTCVILGLYPLVANSLLADGRIIVDAKSGLSGAGRSLSLKTHFVEANENFSPYRIGRAHRHIAEMEQELKKLGDRDYRIIFSPHLLPVNRGILTTIYVRVEERLSEGHLLSLYRESFKNELFIHVLEDTLASLRYVVGTNHCAISLTKVGKEDLIVVSAIDNLLKGASGQAVQNMNVMFGLEEGIGLE